MRRRDFIRILGSLAAIGPVTARAQERTKRIGFVVGAAVTRGAPLLGALREGLAGLGWNEGRNIEIVAHFGADDPDKIRAYVAEIVRFKPDAIVAGNSAMVAALMKETRTIPIVLTNVTDPVALGLVENLARPGGNVTGFTNFEANTASKWLELLREVAPQVRRVITLVDASQLSGPVFARAIENAASALHMPTATARIRDETDIQQAIMQFAPTPDGGVIVPPSPGLANKGKLILRLMAFHRLPNVHASRSMVIDGGLISYAPDLPDLYRRTASYVDRILKGTNPGDLPIQNPTKYELIINLKAAKALGLDVPWIVRQRADEVIE
jgi:putative ABC transport system substrate-binding protein